MNNKDLARIGKQYTFDMKPGGQAEESLAADDSQTRQAIAERMVKAVGNPRCIDCGKLQSEGVHQDCLPF